MPLDERLAEDLKQKKTADLYRIRSVRQNKQSSLIDINGKTYLNFCSNDYLGLANHPEIVMAAKKALDQYGLGSGGSALVTGYTDVHHQLEDALADFTGRTRALLFNSGFTANVGVLSTLINKTDNVIMDKLCHASLIDGVRLSGAKLRRYQHLNTEKLKGLLDSSLNNDESWVISESLYSMDGDHAPLERIAKLSCGVNTNLYIDDAHGFGIYGEQGAGSINAAKLTEREVPVMVATFGKAFGAAGAFVAGSDTLIESLVQNSRSYIYTTAMPPANAAAVLKSLELVKADSWRRDKLFELITYFREQAEKIEIPLLENALGPIQPVIIGDSKKAMNVSNNLANRGVKVTAIRAPTVAKNAARLRITLSSAHTKKQIDTLLEVLNEVLSNEQ